MVKIYMDDGFNPEFVETAFFDGVFEMPLLERPKQLVIPKQIVPFSARERANKTDTIVSFYEYDSIFGDVVKRPELYVDDFKRYMGIITPDCSVYVDSPLAVQIANVYRNRAIGYYYQNKGLYTIPNVRWGDERSYTTEVLPEKIAFMGLLKQSIYSVGTYGCCKTAEERFHLRNGLLAMIEELEPEIILIYGAMPDTVFHDLIGLTRFVQFPDWTTLKRGKCHGNE